jgi:hypothetical protein
LDKFLFERCFSRIKQDRSAILIQFHHNRSDTRQPLFATVPFTSGHLSFCLNSISVSRPPASFFGPATVGHLSSLSAIPSFVRHTLSKPNTSGQASSLSATPSPSVSGQPFNAAKPNTSGQASALS